jgi:hypothetical protein
LEPWPSTIIITVGAVHAEVVPVGEAMAVGEEAVGATAVRVAVVVGTVKVVVSTEAAVAEDEAEAAVAVVLVVEAMLDAVK